MSEQNEQLHPKQAIEVTPITDVPFETTLPGENERLIIGAKPRRGGEAPEPGIEVVSLADYPKDEKGNTIFGTDLIRSDVLAIMINPLQGMEGGYKGLRANESITSAVLSKRFNTDVRFGAALDENGKLLIENTRPDISLDALTIKEEPEATQAPEVSELLTADAAEIAKKIMALEDAERTHPSQEIAMDVETEAALLREKATEDLGEEAVEEVIELAEAEEARGIDQEKGLEQVQAEYEQQLAALFADLAGETGAQIRGADENVEQAHAVVALAERTIEGGTGALRRIIARFESDRDKELAIRMLQEVVNDLSQASAQLAGATEQSSDARKRTNGIKTNLEDAVQLIRSKENAYVGAVHELTGDSEEARDVLRNVPNTTEEMRSLSELGYVLEDALATLGRTQRGLEEYTGQTRAAVNVIDMIVQDARRGQLDVDGLRTAAARLDAAREEASHSVSLNVLDEVYEKALRTVTAAAER